MIFGVSGAMLELGLKIYEIRAMNYDGRNPANHLGWLKPYEQWGIVIILGGAGFCPLTVWLT